MAQSRPILIIWLHGHSPSQGHIKMLCILSRFISFLACYHCKLNFRRRQRVDAPDGHSQQATKLWALQWQTTSPPRRKTRRQQKLAGSSMFGRHGALQSYLVQRRQSRHTRQRKPDTAEKGRPECTVRRPARGAGLSQKQGNGPVMTTRQASLSPQKQRDATACVGRSDLACAAALEQPEIKSTPAKTRDDQVRSDDEVVIQRCQAWVRSQRGMRWDSKQFTHFDLVKWKLGHVKAQFFHVMTTGYLQHINFTPQHHHC